MAGLIIAEEQFDLADTSEKLVMRIYAPVLDQGTTWACRVELGPPFDVDRNIYGEGSLQALALGLKHVASVLYGTTPWREGKLGLYGEFGGYLGVPAPTSYLDFAPFPF